MAEKQKENRISNPRDVSRLLLLFGTKKVAYDGNIPEVVEMYAKYSGKTKERTSFFSGKTDKDIFIYAMCLGKKSGKQLPFEKKDGKTKKEDNIDMVYFNRNPEYLWMMLATALVDTKDPETGEPTLNSLDPDNVLDICQSYANAGIHELIKMENDVGRDDPLKSFDKKLSELLE